MQARLAHKFSTFTMLQRDRRAGKAPCAPGFPDKRAPDGTLGGLRTEVPAFKFPCACAGDNRPTCLRGTLLQHFTMPRASQSEDDAYAYWVSQYGYASSERGNRKRRSLLHEGQSRFWLPEEARS